MIVQAWDGVLKKCGVLTFYKNHNIQLLYTTTEVPHL